MKIVNGEVISLNDAPNKKISSLIKVMENESKKLKLMVDSLEPKDDVDKRNIGRAKDMVKGIGNSLGALKMVVEAF